MPLGFQVDEGLWILEEDLRRPIPGRIDPEEKIENCLAYLYHFHRRGAVPFHARAQSLHTWKATGEILAALIKSSAIGTGREKVLADLVEVQKDAIDRLLAFLPAKASEPPPERMDEILAFLEEQVRGEFGTDSSLSITVLQEDDKETAASYRIVFEVRHRSDVTPDDYSKAEFRIFRSLAGFLNNEERRAIRLVIEEEILD